jgi:hypothetical protein
MLCLAVLQGESLAGIAVPVRARVQRKVVFHVWVAAVAFNFLLTLMVFS